MKILNGWCYLRIKPWRKSQGWVIGYICKIQVIFVEHYVAESTGHSVLDLGHGSVCTACVWKTTPVRGYETKSRSKVIPVYVRYLNRIKLSDLEIAVLY